MKGHGRNGVSAYRNAGRIKIEHNRLRPGDRCPECPRGKVFCLKRPVLVLRITGHAPINAVIYELERLRCSSCQKIFKARLPDEAGEKKYDERAGAIISIKIRQWFSFLPVRKSSEGCWYSLACFHPVVDRRRCW